MDVTETNKPVLSAASFDQSIAVNAHIGYGWGAYNDASLVIDDLNYLGVTTIRDAFATDPSTTPVMDALASAGFKFDFVVPSDLPAEGTAGLQEYLTSIDSFLAAHPGSVVALEGLNEANIQSFSYNGSSSMAAAAQFQEAFYTAVKSDAALKNIPVYNMTLGLNDANASAQLGNLASSADYANAHAYVATSTPESYGLNVSLGLADSNAAGKPTVITEEGYSTLTRDPGLGTDQTVQAKSILNSLADAFNDGVSKSYLYELLDQNSSSSDTNAEDHFGLFNSDGTPKLAATAIHNLTTILADDGTGGKLPTAPLDYELQNLPSTGNSMVLAKSDGAYDLVVWAEPKLWNDTTDTEIVNPTNVVTVNLDSVHKLVQIYDPLDGTTPIATYTNVQEFQIAVSDHPVIIEIDGVATSSALAAVTPLSINGTAADIVAQLSTLNDEESSVASITLTDSHVLPVASEATMQYIISHYGDLLSKIQGGYSFSVTISASTWRLITTYDKSGNVISTENTAYSNGVTAYDLVTYADGSTATSNYVNGVKTQMIVVNADQSKDTYTYGITGKSYVTLIQHVDSSGHLTSNTMISASGTTTTDQFNLSGKLVSETVSNPDGSSSTSVYVSGVKTQMFVTNADQTHDNYLYGITGQTYVSQVQHVNAAGVVTSVERYHANGSLDYSQTTSTDGTITSIQYNSSGVISSESVLHTNGLKDIYAFNIQGQSYTTEHSEFNASGSLVLFERFHSDGSYALKVTNVNGVSTSDQFNSTGVLLNETVTNPDGSSSLSTYVNGVKSTMVITNADHSQDKYSYVVGQPYTTVDQHFDSSGHLTSTTETHANGTLYYTQVISGSDRIGTQYNAQGVETLQSIVHQDGTHDIYTYGITGQSYTSEHDVFNASGSLTSLERFNSNGSEELKVTKAADGSSVTDQFDANGVLVSEIDKNADGSSSTSIYSSGEKIRMAVTNADHSQDIYAYGITSQTYNDSVQHINASGRVTSIERTHSDGTLDFSETFASDGSTVSLHYDAQGNETSKVTVATDGTKDIFTFNFGGAQNQTQMVSYNSSGQALFSDLTQTDGSHLITTFVAGLSVSGGSTDDHFVFNASSTNLNFSQGNDQVDNFHAGTAAGHDTIDISKTLAASFDQLSFQQMGSDTLVHVNATDSILLTHVTANSLSQGNFLFT
jgi:hypothetical protein